MNRSTDRFSLRKANGIPFLSVWNKTTGTNWGSQLDIPVVESPPGPWRTSASARVSTGASSAQSGDDVGLGGGWADLRYLRTWGGHNHQVNDGYGVCEVPIDICSFVASTSVIGWWSKSEKTYHPVLPVMRAAISTRTIQHFKCTWHDPSTICYGRGQLKPREARNIHIFACELSNKSNIMIQSPVKWLNLPFFAGCC